MKKTKNPYREKSPDEWLLVRDWVAFNNQNRKMQWSLKFWAKASAVPCLRLPCGNIRVAFGRDKNAWNLIENTILSQPLEYCMLNRNQNFKKLWFRNDTDMLGENLYRADTFSTTMIYRASVFITSLSNRFMSPDMACPEGPQAEQSTISCFGSFWMLQNQESKY